MINLSESPRGPGPGAVTEKKKNSVQSNETKLDIILTEQQYKWWQIINIIVKCKVKNMVSKSIFIIFGLYNEI